MKRKGFLGMPIVFFMLLILTMVVAVVLLLFFTGFLDNAVKWLRGIVTGFFEFFRSLFSGIWV